MLVKVKKTIVGTRNGRLMHQEIVKNDLPIRNENILKTFFFKEVVLLPG